jgi:phage terminase large subunit-like protein
MSAAAGLTPAQINDLAAVDHRFYNKHFLSRAYRDPFPIFYDSMWDRLEAVNSRFVNLQLYRGSGKTTNLRSFMSKRIAYGISRTMLYIAASATKAEQSVGWIKRQVERNELWRDFYGLRLGDKWTEGTLEIIHTRLDISIWVIAFGLTGKHRGINIDDYRPDFIGIDDIIDEEVAASAEQRDKAENLVLGSLVDSLAPRSENPQAKMVMLQTPFNHEDPSMKALKDPMWVSMVQGCWTKDTENLPLDQRQSVWPERESSADLRDQRIGAIARNKLSLFTREKECKLTTPESSFFKREWLKFYDDVEEACRGAFVVIGIDPVPPPTEAQIAKQFRGKDFECLSVIAYKNLDYYLLEYTLNRGHQPDWTIGELFRLIYRWRPKKIRVETVAYQKTLQWLITKEMATRRRFVPVEEMRDKRAKTDRISDAISGPASHGHLYIRPSHHDFITQFTDYPAVIHDDLLDATASAIDGCIDVELGDELGDDDDEPLHVHRGCP